MEKYISDDKIILKLAGLRWVEKIDHKSMSGPDTFLLKWNYKGAEGQATYTEIKERDEIYNKLRAALGG